MGEAEQECSACLQNGRSICHETVQLFTFECESVAADFSESNNRLWGGCWQAARRSEM